MFREFIRIMKSAIGMRGKPRPDEDGELGRRIIRNNRRDAGPLG